MVRQCAWCLCLIDNAGERISPSPLPKLYEATHGICGTCGIQWMEQVMAADEAATGWQHGDNGGDFPEVEQRKQQEERRETITQLILQLQQNSADIPADSQLKSTRKTRSL